MSRIKQLKSEASNNINIVDILSLICLNKSKYVDTLLRIIKKEKKFKSNVSEIKKFLSDNFNISDGDLKTIPDHHLLFYHTFMESMMGIEEIKKFQDFCTYNERGLIINNDLSKYSSFDQVLTSISIAELKEYEKEMETQIIKLHEDDEYLIMKPLTHESSRKYGSNTKWCTTMESPIYFNNYGGTGILIYVINKKSGRKTASMKELKHGTISYWNQVDKKIELEETNLPQYVINVIQKGQRVKYSNTYYFTNRNVPVTIDEESIIRRSKLSMKIGHAIRRENDDMTELPIKIKK